MPTARWACRMPCSLNNIQTLAVVDKREEHQNFFPARSPKSLADLLSRRLALQIGQHGPAIEHNHFTSGFAHARRPCFRARLKAPSNERPGTFKAPILSPSGLRSTGI